VAYPIVTLSWILMRKDYKDPNKLAALKDLVRYCLTEGQAQSEALGYIPAPSAVQAIILERLYKAFEPRID
jgi:phosphate transport system substrate-binding protein